MNFVEVLQRKELGFGSRQLKPFAKQPLVKLLIRTRWAFAENIHSDHRVLLGGDFCCLAYRLTSLVGREIRRAPQETSPKDEKSGELLIEQLKERDTVRFSLLELLDLIRKQGFELGLTHQEDICLISYDSSNQQELLKYVLAYSVERKDYPLFKMICISLLRRLAETRDMDGFTQILKLLRSMFNTGYNIHRKSCEDWISAESKDIINWPFDLVLILLKFFIEHGISVSQVFKNLCTYRIIHRCLVWPKKFKDFLSYARVFIENQIALPEALTEEQRSVSEVFKSSFKKSDAPDMLVFVESCIENKIDNITEDNDGYNMLLIICRWYDGRDFAAVVNLLCNGNGDVNCRDYFGQNALNLLADREDCTKELLDSVKVLIKHGVDVNQTDPVGLNPLHRFVCNRTNYCCNIKRLTHWRESGFWDVLNALLDAGCRVEPLVYNGSSLLLEVLQRTAIKVCFYCPKSVDASFKSQLFSPAFQFIERLIQAGASLTAVLNPKQKEHERETVLLYVAANYKGDDLLALVELLSKHGADVNAITTSKVNSCGYYRRTMDIIEIMKRENPSETHLANRLMEVLLRYGFCR